MEHLRLQVKGGPGNQSPPLRTEDSGKGIREGEMQARMLKTVIVEPRDCHKPWQSIHNRMPEEVTVTWGPGSGWNRFRMEVV